MTLSRSSNAKEVDEHPLYSGSYRVRIPLLLVLMMVSDGIVLMCATLIAARDISEYKQFLPPSLIPLIAALASFLQFVQRARRGLDSSHVVLLACLAITMWVVYACMGLITHDQTHAYNPWVYCALPGIVLNMIYLALGATALHASRIKNEVEDVEHTPKRPESTPIYLSSMTPAPATVPDDRPPSYHEDEDIVLPPYKK